MSVQFSRWFICLAVVWTTAATGAGADKAAALSDFLRGSVELSAVLGQGDVEEVAVLESFLARSRDLNEDAYLQIYRQLGAATWPERETASRQLVDAGTCVLAWIERDLPKERDPEIRHRLQQVYTGAAQWKSRWAELQKQLLSLYQRHAENLWKKRVVDLPGWDAPPPASRQFVAALTVEQLQKLLPQAGAERRLAVLLRLLFEHDLQSALRIPGNGGAGSTEWADELRKFEAPAILAECARLWAVELQPPTQDGSYFWTYRAEKETKTGAENVVEISIEQSSSPAHIVHFQVYREARSAKNGYELHDWKGAVRKASTFTKPAKL